MPIPVPDALSAHEDLAVAKATQAKSSMGRYLLSSMLAGAYVGVAVLLLIMTSAPLVAAGSGFAKLVQGAVFGVALTLVVFAGAELFTGNNMIMLQGYLKKKVSAADVALVWVASLVGNFVGSLLFAWVVDGSGVITGGSAQPGTPSAFQNLLASISTSKANLDGGQLYLRSVLCNVLVCLALWMAARAAGDAAKLVVLWWALLAFIASGFEHSVANMTVLGLAAMTGVGEWSELFRNLLYTVPGNVVGGGLVIGLAYGWLGKPIKATPPVVTVEVPEEPLPEPAPKPVRARKAPVKAAATSGRATSNGNGTARKATAGAARGR